jgi:hypothetical protein
MKTKKCKCGADIAFVEMTSGKQMPVDAKAEQMIVMEHTAHHIGGPVTSRGRMMKAYRPHWGTCPLAKQFKKEKGD